MSTDTSQAPSLGEMLDAHQEEGAETSNDHEPSSESDYKAESEAEEGQDDEDADMTMKLQEVMRQELGETELETESEEAAQRRPDKPAADDEILLSDLSEDEAVAASLA